MKFNVPRPIHPEMKSSEMRNKADAFTSHGEVNEHAGERRQQGFIDKIRDSSHVPRDVRINLTPNGTDAYFVGYKGESKCIPNPESDRGKRAAIELEKYGQNGIEFKNGFPDFSKVAEATVKIGDMSTNRYGIHGNFAQAEEKLAQQWNEAKRQGRDNWTSRDVRTWRKENNLIIHEREDTKTCDFVNRDIHETFRHSGGVAECKARDAASTGNGLMRGADFFAIFDN